MIVKRIFLCSVVSIGISVAHQPVIYSWGITSERIIELTNKVVPMLIADGISLAVTELFNRIRHNDAFQIPEFDSVPNGRGQIAPASVPDRVKSIIDLIKDPQGQERLRQIKCHLEPGILLHGASGQGKTQLGYYMAREAGCKVAYVSSASLATGQKRAGPYAVRTLFDRVYKPGLWSRFRKFAGSLFMRIVRRSVPQEKPVILILDDIDSIGGARFTGRAQGAAGSQCLEGERERVRTLNELLTRLDGAYPQEAMPKVFVVATAKEDGDMRIHDYIDKALIREGRLEPLHVDLDQDGRAAVCDFYAREHRVVVDDACKQYIVNNTDGWSGANLQSLLRQVASSSLRPITQTALDPIIARIGKRVGA